MSNNKDGFTLLEVMMSLVIFSIGIIAVLSMQVNAIKTNSKADKINEQVNDLSSVAEDILSISFSTLVVGAELVYERDNYKVRAYISQPSSISDYKNITVKVFNKDNNENAIRTFDFVKKRI